MPLLFWLQKQIVLTSMYEIIIYNKAKKENNI